MRRLWNRLLGYFNLRPSTSAMSLLVTKEGREKLAELIAKRYPAGAIKPEVEICPTCEGFGKLGHHTALWNGGATEFTGDEICGNCGGTGIKGGLDYVNVHCTQCGGKGINLGGEEQEIGKLYPKCYVCNGTGIVKVKKGDVTENA
jgi:hypothetical protein